MRNRSWRLFLPGFVTWLVPFLISFGFYDRAGNLNVSYGFFKCSMVVLSSVTGMWALSRYMQFVHENFRREGFIAGVAWLLINYVLDLIVLVPMAGITIKEYFMTIGLGYLQIPIVTSAVGIIMQRKFVLR